MKTVVRRVRRALARQSPHRQLRIERPKALPFWRVTLSLIGSFILIRVGVVAAKGTDSVLLGLMSSCVTFLVATSIWSSLTSGR